MDEATRTRHETQSKNLRVKIKTWEVNFAKANQGNKPTRQDIKSNRDMAATYKQYQYLRDVLDGKKPPPAATKQDRQTADKENLKHKSPKQHKSQLPAHSHNTPSTRRFRTAAETDTPSSQRQHYLDVNSTMHMFTPRAGGDGDTSTFDNDITTITTPSLNRKLFSPVVPTSIGPTPHRDGRVLGLFDMLPFKGAEIGSPSKPSYPSMKLSQVKKGGKESMIQESPKKRRSDEAAEADEPTFTTSKDATLAAALGHTPLSRHKRQKQTPRKTDNSAFATPCKPDGSNNTNRTPGTAKSITATSVSKLQFLTPAFLRRIPMSKITESSEMLSPEPIRLPRKPLLRGLSSVVADLRKLQEKELDDELDNLREIENEAMGGTLQKPPATTTATTAHDLNDPLTASPSKVTRRQSQQQPHQQQQEAAAADAADDQEALAFFLQEDAQSKKLKLLSGFDDEAKYDSSDDEGEVGHAGLDRNGQPLRVFKKKGQKRTTRRSNMRPVRTQRPPDQVTTTAATDDDDDDGVNDHGEDADATKPAAVVRGHERNGREEDPALLSGSDFTASDSNVDDEDDDDDGDEYGVVSKNTSVKTTADYKTDSKSISKTKREAPSSSSKTASKTNKDTSEDKDKTHSAKELTKKAPRKVNELAHANFKRLKLRNNGAKGGPGFNSRFRRRR
ncbi:DNA replication/checkpoint protein [Coniella lustricola]|uniref:DNA replication regulator SLD2 n=1 Tax=Coniella lustricola TaxID=2025994 RepID=A0A2T3A7M6_9PEZI|nr:DNA replication/checkpoint protein [Coniella lustricola]